jgi:hypothetical protein
MGRRSAVALAEQVQSFTCQGPTAMLAASIYILEHVFEIVKNTSHSLG